MCCQTATGLEMTEQARQQLLMIANEMQHRRREQQVGGLLGVPVEQVALLPAGVDRQTSGLIQHLP